MSRSKAKNEQPSTCNRLLEATQALDALADLLAESADVHVGETHAVKELNRILEILNFRISETSWQHSTQGDSDLEAKFKQLLINRNGLARQILNAKSDEDMAYLRVVAARLVEPVTA